MRHLRKFENPVKLAYAKKLRKAMPKAQSLLWYKIRRKQLGFKFRREVVLFGWIIDFYCPKKKLAIEVDGYSHEKRKKEDVFRDKTLAGHGITTIRIQNSQVYNQIELSLEVIKKALGA